jgi:chorismate mutase/prephenate dehydratase
VEEVQALLQNDKIEVIDRIKLPIIQMLVATEGTELSSVRKIYSHEKAIQQCEAFLATMPDCKIIPYSTTSAAASAIAALNDKYSAAIASKTAAKLNRLVILKESIQDSDENYTEFVVIKKK